MQRIAAAVLLIIISKAALASSIEDELLRNNLTAQNPPAGGITYEKLHLGSYQVTTNGEDLSISLLPQERSQEKPEILEVDGFKIEGTDNGEWGGQLTLTSPNGSPVTLLKENVVSIQEDEGSIYIFTGLSHMSIDSGTMYELINIKTKPELVRVTMLPSSPMHIIFDEGIAYILTYAGLIAINPFHQEPSFEIIVHEAPWQHFAPNSLVKQGNNFVIGMHSGVTVVKSNIYGASDVKFYAK
ncbi:hypothetical protein D3C85_970650 [compost metagenome]